MSAPKEAKPLQAATGERVAHGRRPRRNARAGRLRPDGPAGTPEWIACGPTASLYRRFVRLVLALTVVLAVANGLVVLVVLAVSSGIANARYLAGEGHEPDDRHV
jgi:hypothetical protein